MSPEESGSMGKQVLVNRTSLGSTVVSTESASSLSQTESGGTDTLGSKQSSWTTMTSGTMSQDTT